MSLPTLPKNEGLEKALGCSVVHYHEAIAYGQQCRAKALDEAAQVCDERANGENDAQYCADRIRSLK